MSQSSLDIGWCVEEMLIQILSQTPALLALNPTHQDADVDTENVRIVVKAERVLREAANPRNPQLNVRKVEMRIQIRASLGQIEAPQLYSDYGLMCQILENMDGAQYASLPALAYFIFLQPTLELGNEREQDGNRRKMIKTMSFLAILKTPPI